MWIVSQDRQHVVNLDRVVCISIAPGEDGNVCSVCADGVVLASFTSKSAAAEFVDHICGTLGYNVVKYAEHLIKNPGYITLER